MAVRTREEITNLINERITGTDDATLELIGDLTDTLADYDNRLVDADTRYNDLDKSWRTRYRDRFLSGGNPNPKPPETPNSEPETPENRAETITIDDLFTERK